ncbi:hypothetical protein BH09ACT7_BH09ACT7_29310 [soil metagenome]
MLSSLALSDQTSFSTVRLPRDDAASTFADPTAHGTLHWVPLHDSGLRERTRLIADWVSEVKPDLMVVDVSVEVAMLSRLLGIPIAVMAMPGDRTDTPHDLVYRAADHIVAPWPHELYAPSWLRAHASKTTYVGGISRFDDRAVTSAPAEVGIPNILVLNGAGGSWTDDPWPALCAADVVISSAGQNSVADIAAAGRPAIIVAEDRPFAEQHAMAWALERGGLAVVQHGWPELQDWPALIDRARNLDRDRWQRWETRGAAARAAATIERAAQIRASA